MTSWRRPDAGYIKALVSIEDVLGAFGIVLNHRGRTRCPVHGGNNPESFSVYRDRFHCFACNADGDVFDLVQALAGVGFNEAYSWLADLAGLAPHCAPLSRRGRAAFVQRSGVPQRWSELYAWRNRAFAACLQRLRGLQLWKLIVSASVTEHHRLGNHRAEDTAWDSLAAVAHAIDEARWRLELLATDDREDLMLMWVAERPTPDGSTAAQSRSLSTRQAA